MPTDSCTHYSKLKEQTKGLGFYYFVRTVLLDGKCVYLLVFVDLTFATASVSTQCRLIRFQ